MASEENPTRSDTVGNSIGLVVFFIGIGLLVFAFVMAFGLFRQPDMLTAIATAPPGAAGAKGGSPVTGALSLLAVKIIGLFVMVLVGSLVAGKGVHLYLASRHSA